MAKEVKEVAIEEVETAETPNIGVHDVLNQTKEEALLTEIAYLKEQLASTQAIPAPAEAEEKSVEDYLKERVPFEAFKDNDKYKDDIHVGINGHNTIIKRGVRVMIPRYVYMAIQDSDRQTLEADINAENKSKKFDNESKSRGFDN